MKGWWEEPWERRGRGRFLLNGRTWLHPDLQPALVAAVAIEELVRVEIEGDAAAVQITGFSHLFDRPPRGLAIGPPALYRLEAPGDPGTPSLRAVPIMAADHAVCPATAAKYRSLRLPANGPEERAG